MLFPFCSEVSTGWDWCADIPEKKDVDFLCPDGDSATRNRVHAVICLFRFSEFLSPSVFHSLSPTSSSFDLSSVSSRNPSSPSVSPSSLLSDTTLFATYNILRKEKPDKCQG